MATATRLAVWARLLTLSDVPVILWPLTCRRMHLSGVLRAKSVPPVNDHWKLVETVVSSLRTDCIAAAGLGLSRRKVWEAWLEGYLLSNGQVLRNNKRQKVREGDVIELDMECPVHVNISDTNVGSPPEGGKVRGRRGVGKRKRRSRVVVHEVGSSTKKGRYHVKLKRIIEYCSVLPAPPVPQVHDS